MRLKTLEIQGFKSFADKTQFEFHPGVTAIVGPNGCGKSNVVDSIRWVLGETSAKALRGGEMADVIFNGTDKRKPVGLAEVTLTFADCEEALKVDYNEVSLTRRVFRDGRSEYRINNRLCRLKDIQNMLMDTGIGRTAYSIMEQGKIDQLLSSKPEDRRAVFEEAAGITKFKVQKKEALRKLEYTESNLLRVTDIIAELTRQRDSLQRQANKAKRYREMLDDLTTLDTHWTHRQYRELRAEKDELANSILSLTQVEENSRQQVEKKSQDLSKKREELEAAEAEHHQLALELVSLKNKIHTSQDRMESNRERAEEFKRFVARNENQIQETQSKLLEQRMALETAEQSLLSLQSRLEGQRSELSEAENEHKTLRGARIEWQSKLQQLQGQRQGLVGQIASLEALHLSKSEQREADARRASTLEEELNALQGEKEQFEQEVERLSAEIQEEAAALEACQQERGKLENQAQRVQHEQQEARNALRDAERAVSATKSRRDILVQWVEQGEGFEKGTQRVLQGLDEPKTFKGSIRGVLGSMLTVKDDQHLPAVEAALREHAQTVLVANGVAAEGIMERLAERQLGFASVVPEDSAGEKAKGSTPADCVSLLSLVEVDAKVESLMERLLGCVYFAPSLARAREAQIAHPGSSFVTAKGELVTAEGIIHGGATKQAKESVLQKQSEIKKLEKEIKKLEEKHKTEAKRLAETDAEVLNVQSQRNELNDKTQQHKLNRSRLEDQRRSSQMELQRSTSRAAKLRGESDELARRATSAESELRRISGDLTRRKSELSALETSGTDAEGELHRLSEKENDAGGRLNELRTRLALEEQAAMALQSQRQPMAGRLNELDGLVGRYEEEILSFRRRQEELENENQQLQSIAKQSREEVEHLAKRQEESHERRKGIQGAVREFEGLLARMNQERSAMQDQRGREEVRVTQLELRIENLTATISERYQLDLAAFEPDAHQLLLSLESYKSRAKRSRSEGSQVEVVVSLEDEPDWEFIGAAVKEMRQKLDGMGPVNLDAIQEFEEAEERLQFLQEQLDDLTKSKTELLEVLAKINTESRKQFAETFEQVRKNFHTMFRELFGDSAKADLSLVDENDPLESGIDIIAKPPGKKLQTISLLSGGERSMTAVALLFAIYMVKPSPFCVLDELDAPLDEANIGRFTNILDRFIEQSQFVIVTHNKRTMNRADVMYGVTMEEFGVSKPVGMKLTEETKRKESARVMTPLAEGSQAQTEAPAAAEEPMTVAS